jgi:colanic acid biosynthesis glycosyl transferase WcaI
LSERRGPRKPGGPASVWIVSELYYPEETSTGYLLTRIAEGLARHVPVNVIAGQPTYSARGTRAPAREEREGVDIHRCIGTTLDKDVPLLRLLNAVTLSASIFLSVLRRVRKGDAVLVVTNPPPLPFVVYLACRLRGARCLLLIHDVYPEVLVASGMAAPGSLLVRAVGWLTRLLYRGVERIIVLGRDMEQLVHDKLGHGNERVAVIPNWADLELVSARPREGNALLRELALQDRFVVQYAGNMGRTHGIETLIDAAVALRGTRVHFVFIGSGAKKRWIEERVQGLGLENVTVLGNRPRSDQDNFLNACDITVISFVRGMAGVSVPSRMYNVMAAGKPILAVADDHSELALVVRENDIGWVLAPGDSQGIVDCLRHASENADRVRDMGRRARAVAEERYSLGKVIESYRELFPSSV